MKKQTSAADLGFDLDSNREEELFKWFLACLLFGKPIQTNIAEQAYHAIVAAHLCIPDAILKAGSDELVRLLDGSHYVRYDFSTATSLAFISCFRKKVKSHNRECVLCFASTCKGGPNGDHQRIYGINGGLSRLPRKTLPGPCGS
jgi:hypothetical protein